ncbi:hypothetical protein [Enterobacter roggenkampii]|uniref:hypothetical protein n=1 Tax=Enterobacter roggenkampii TaxID=1812935 RepID=UPI00107E8FCC|nr:hypothetical protein [Enterobacter roggenkampii]QBX83406.1 hypothetical protein E4005_00470 [Enterobacter roggenkampii]
MEVIPPVEAESSLPTRYETTAFERLYAKTRELISGDRAEVICRTETLNTESQYGLVESNLISKSTERKR